MLSNEERQKIQWPDSRNKKHQMSIKPTVISVYKKQINLTPDDFSVFVIETVYKSRIL